MTSGISLLSILTPFQYALLRLIQDIREQLKQAQVTSGRNNGEPIIVLPQNYIVSLFRCSPNTVVLAIDRLCELGVLVQVSNIFGQCAEYRYAPSVYRSLLKKANEEQITLTTGRSKTRQNISTDQVLQYIIGKSINKAYRGAASSPTDN